MEQDSKLRDSVSEVLLRSMVSIEHAADRAARFSVGQFASKLAAFTVLFYAGFDGLVQLAGLREMSASASRSVGNFEWLMLFPLGVVAVLLFRVHRNERERSRLESRLTSAALEAIRRDLLD